MAARKHSHKRDAILACLRSTTSHPTADWIYTRLKPQYPDLSLATVYRNLAQFKQSGDVLSVGVVEGVERFDGNPAPHAHFVCECCGAVQDIAELHLPDSLFCQAAAQLHAVIHTGAVTLSGLCGACAEEEAPKED